MKDLEYRHIDNHLNKLRTDCGLSQETLASIVGVSRNSLGAIERGTALPNLRLALVLCEVFDKKVEDIFYFRNEDKR